MKRPVIFFLLLLGSISCQLLSETKPRILIVTAHPDDETGCAVAVYKATHYLKASVDLFLITNGEGGYKYSTLAEDIYGAELTDEATGRELLPSIRKKELMNGGKILGIRNYYFLDQQDNKYTLDLHNVISTVWDTVLIKKRISDVITERHYDYVFCLLPVPETHAHHKGATLYALRAIRELPENQRPVILAYSVRQIQDSVKARFTSLEGYPETTVNQSSPVFLIDRTASFGYKNKLNYKVIVNWVIAEHKSQGVMQLYMNMGDIEEYYYFNQNSPDKIATTAAFFDRLKVIPYPEKSYTE